MLAFWLLATIPSRLIESKLLGKMPEGPHTQHTHLVQKCFRVMQFRHPQDNEPLMLVLPPGLIQVPLQVSFLCVVVKVGLLIASSRDVSTLLITSVMLSMVRWLAVWTEAMITDIVVLYHSSVAPSVIFSTAFCVFAVPSVSLPHVKHLIPTF